MISYEKISGYNSNKEGVKCMICNHYHFKDKFDYQPYVCNECHNFSMTVMDLSDFFTFLWIKEYYKWYFIQGSFIQKDFIQILLQ